MYYGYDGGYGHPFDGCGCYGGGYSYGVVGGGYGCRNSFALIVVLFILLIIIGACWVDPK